MGEVAMRTAAFSGYRSATARRPHTLPSAAAASSTVHEVNEGSPLISSISSERITAVQRPVWELDDWEFADAGLDLVEDLDPKPRLVFGPFPGAEEAEEATKDLKETIDKISIECVEFYRFKVKYGDSGDYQVNFDKFSMQQLPVQASVDRVLDDRLGRSPTEPDDQSTPEDDRQIRLTNT